MNLSLMQGPALSKSKNEGSSRLRSNCQASMAQSAASAAESVVVVVNAGKEITKHALEWALSNVVQAGDHITFVALLQGGRNGNYRHNPSIFRSNSCPNIWFQPP